MNSKTLIGALIGAILGAVAGPYVAADFTTVYVFQAGEYRILGAFIGAILGALILYSVGKGKHKILFESKEGEKTLVQVDASYEFQTGKMRITDRRILFRSDASTIELPFESILEVETAKTLGILPNAILIRTAGGNKLKIIVANRGKVMEIMKGKAPHS